LNRNLNRNAESEKYKNILLTEAPQSVYAQIILDPTYLEKMALLKSESEQLYEQAFNQFNNNNFTAVIAIVDNALGRFPNDALTPMFAYLKAISAGRLAGTNEAMREEMRKITLEYPETEIAVSAQNLIDVIDGVEPELKQIEQVERAQVLYTYIENEPHYFVWMIDSRENVTQLLFDLQAYAADYFVDYQFEYERVNFDARRIFLMASGFLNFDRTRAFYQTFTLEPESKKNVLYEYNVFLISQRNFIVMESEGNLEDYLEFFKKEYLKQ